MPAKKAGGQLSSPWKEFLAELDRMPGESLELHCIGGFALVHFYGFPRTTADIDYCSAVPANLNLHEVAGRAQLFIRNTVSGFIEWPLRTFPKSMGPGCKKWRQGNSNISNCWYRTPMTAFCQSWNEAAERTGTMRISCSDLRNEGAAPQPDRKRRVARWDYEALA